ncbi:MAG: DUF2220 domain-containing protein [Firmicutes bacterium]|nr:DUF2220 domain-containing protein [Bacillota bacterium]
MKCNKIDYDQLYQKLKSEINSANGKFILLNRLFSAIEGINAGMPVFLQSPEGQAVFSNLIMRLVHDKIITPVGNKPNTRGLHLKYRINKAPPQKDSRLMARIINSIGPPATLDYYLKNPQDFLKDKAIIDTITSFMEQKEKDWVTVNERAYQLFGDEKFFKGGDKNRSRGEIVLKRLGLDYSSLRCRETVEPFFSFYGKDFFSGRPRQIYIIENLDTFWSFKKNILDSPSRLKADMLIYGEGKKIISSFKFIEEYSAASESDTFFYFGDLDAEGINIYCELKDKYPQYRIYPFDEGYQAILETGLKRGLAKTPKQQKVDRANIDKFTGMFAPSWALKLKKLLEEGFYIPQEALSAAAMKERFGVKDND